MAKATKKKRESNNPYGRPPIEDRLRRVRKLDVRFSDADIEAIQKAADKRGLKVTAHVRERLGLD